MLAGVLPDVLHIGAFQHSVTVGRGAAEMGGDDVAMLFAEVGSKGACYLATCSCRSCSTFSCTATLTNQDFG
jgi:hypothetical protein